MIERILITVGIMGLLTAVVTLGGFIQRRKASTAAQALPTRRRPTVLYFWSEACTPCKLVQTPALDSLERETSQVDVVRINAVAQTDLANTWGVMSVPTTILLNREGQPVHINNRAVQLPELKQQLSELGVVVS
jgi:thioredoxin 1